MMHWLFLLPAFLAGLVAGCGLVWLLFDEIVGIAWISSFDDAEERK